VAQPPSNEDAIDDKPMPLLDHLIELRTRLIWSIAAFIVAFAVCYYFSKNIYSFLAQPLADILHEKTGQERRMIFTHLTEAFLHLPEGGDVRRGLHLLSRRRDQLWLFVAPGLYRSEKRALMPSWRPRPSCSSWAVRSPTMSSSRWPGASSSASKSGQRWRHADPAGSQGQRIPLLVMKLIFAFGIAFEMPVGLLLLAKVGIISSPG